jgi:uncharacterized protein involved in exopolysaccharide biosynthesis/Mrp family chromosome partitioning ATPase
MEEKQTARNPVNVPSTGIKIADIYYVLFRHKWLVVGFSLVAIAAAVSVYLLQQPLYWSEAKLLVRYVVDSKSAVTGSGSTKSPDYGGDSVINSEMEILTSLDLCQKVAEIIGPEKILGRTGASNVTASALIISRGLTAVNPPHSTIIKVRFAHPEPAVARLVLEQLIQEYFIRHKAVHLDTASYDEVLTTRAQQILARIRQNEEELRSLKAKAQVISVEDAKKNYSEEMSHLRLELFNTEFEIAEYRSMIGAAPAAAKDTNVTETVVPPDKVSEYKFVCAGLDVRRNRELDLLSQFTEENPQVKRVHEQIVELDKKKKALETDFPRLVGMYVAQPQGAVAAAEPRLNPARVGALEAKVDVITNRMARIRSEVTLLDNLETAISDVKRKLELDKQTYMHLAAGLEAAGIDEALSAGKMSNIQTVQSPSQPAPNVSQRLKFVAIAFFSCLAAGIALAFVIELFIDRTLRRPLEFESKSSMPLFLSIPRLNLNGHAKLLPFPAPAPSGDAAEGATSDLQNTWDEHHPLRPFIEGLRDRTLIHFEGDPHKPKLIGITSCGGSAGVTSIAAGLAGALSETGDGNVLLLNLNFDAESVHPFYRGELTCDLSDALQLDKRHNGMVLQNLYVATAGSTDPSSSSLPKQLARVVPRLRVSDYDYIVFDLPPTTPTTMTARLAGMMDLVMVVVESGKDTQEAVRQVERLLSRSKARVSAVLNKVHNPVPRWLRAGI